MGIKNLNMLIGKMKPALAKTDFVFCSLAEKKFSKLNIKPLMTFKEKEGTTIIIDKRTADKTGLKYDEVWAMITLSVHSDLTAIGFLAAISNVLADNGISINVVSAYNHDYLFVLKNRTTKTIKLLSNMTKAKNARRF